MDKNKKKRKRRPPKQMYLIGLIWIVIVGIVMILGVPSWRKIRASQIKVTQKQTELSKLVEKQNALASLDVNELQDKVQRTIQVLPIQQDFAVYLASIQHLATRNNLIIRGYSLSPGLIEDDNLAAESNRKGEVTAEKKRVNRKGAQPFEIESLISGKAEDMARFFREMERSAPIKTVPQVTISTDSQAGGLGNVTAKLVFNAYFLPLPGSLPPITSKLPLLNDRESQVLSQLFEYETTPQYVPAEGQNTGVGKPNVFAQQ